MNTFKILRKYQYSSQTAIIYKNIRISYKELVIYSINLSELIINNFGKRKQTIGIFLPNSSDYTIAFFAAAYSDKVIVPFNDIFDKKWPKSIPEFDSFPYASSMWIKKEC